MNRSSDKIEFQSIKELYNRLLPALKAKKDEMRRFGINYIKEEDIWNYLKEVKWKKANNLSLYEMTSDVLNIENELIESYLKNKLRIRKSKPNFEE